MHHDYIRCCTYFTLHRITLTITFACIPALHHGYEFCGSFPRKRSTPLINFFHYKGRLFAHELQTRTYTYPIANVSFFHRKKIKRALLFTDFIKHNATLLCFTDTHYSIRSEVAGAECVYFYVVDVCTYADTRCICMISEVSSFINLFYRSVTWGWISTTVWL